MKAERTFWEKATAIHVFCAQGAFRGGDRFARHWHDVTRLDAAGFVDSAIEDTALAKAVADAGAKAIATGSYGVAEAQGFKDGETLPLEVVLENLRRIVSITKLPVTIDMEAGYGETPDEVQVSVDRAREIGAVGINMEDRRPGKTALLPVAEAAALQFEGEIRALRTRHAGARPDVAAEAAAQSRQDVLPLLSYVEVLVKL